MQPSNPFPSRSPAARYLPLCLLMVVWPGCSDGDGQTAAANPNLPREASRSYRAIAGVSMGGFGALNIGTKRDDLFGVVGSLGGPVDMREMLRQLVRDNLEVKPQSSVPTQVGDDFTFDHLPPYPDRGTRIEMFRDLVLALGNPFLHHHDANRRYLAIHSEPAGIRQDDAFGGFGLPVDARGFFDGGDVNENGVREVGEMAVGEPSDVLLVARGTVAALTGGATGTVVGDRELVDVNGDGVFDVGDGLVVNLSEPFVDLDGDLVFEPGGGETFNDYGLDGVPGTMDFGEGNGVFDYDPDRATWLQQDPYSRLQSWSLARIQQQRLYFDVGDADLLGFAAHYSNLVGMLEGKGLTVRRQSGFAGNCVSVEAFPEPAVFVTYSGGHVGIPTVGSLSEDLRNGDVCGSVIIWQRLLGMIGFMESSFPDGDYGFGGPRLLGDVVKQDLPSPVLTPDGEPTVQRPVVVYRPPAFFNTGRSFPIVYVLGGYGQDPADFERVQLLLDTLIARDEIQNMYLAFVPGQGGYQGSFYLDHEVPHEQAPGLPPSTGRFETSLLEDLLPQIEDGILSGRIRR